LSGWVSTSEIFFNDDHVAENVTDAQVEILQRIYGDKYVVEILD
jgi:hypothetical protein